MLEVGNSLEKASSRTFAAPIADIKAGSSEIAFRRSASPSACIEHYPVFNAQAAVGSTDVVHVIGALKALDLNVFDFGVQRR